MDRQPIYCCVVVSLFLFHPLLSSFTSTLLSFSLHCSHHLLFDAVLITLWIFSFKYTRGCFYPCLSLSQIHKHTNNSIWTHICPLADCHVISLSLSHLCKRVKAQGQIGSLPQDPAGNRGIKLFDNWDGRRCNLSLGSVDLLSQLCFDFKGTVPHGLGFAERLLCESCV